MVEKDMVQIADFMEKTINMCTRAQKKSGKNLKDFLKEIEIDHDLKKIGKEVQVSYNS